MSYILGVDPGLNHTGWGIIKITGNNMGYIASGTINTKAVESMGSRLKKLASGIDNIIEQYKPDECAVEETFINKNPQTSLLLGHARGALILALALKGFIAHEYATRLVKKTVVGNGRAEKQQIIAMLGYLLPGSNVSNADAADALAVAICHFNHKIMHKLTSNQN